MPQLNLRKKDPMALKVAVFFLVIVLHMATSAPCAMAHKVLLSAYVEGNMVFVEDGFSDGTLCKHAKIEVFNPSGNRLLEGKTDENGVFSFKPPQKTDLRLVLNAGMGHRDEYTVPADELPDITGMQKTAVMFALLFSNIKIHRTDRSLYGARADRSESTPDHGIGNESLVQ